MYTLVNNRFPTYRAALIHAAICAQGDIAIAACLAAVIAHVGSDGVVRRVKADSTEIAQICALVSAT